MTFVSQLISGRKVPVSDHVLCGMHSCCEVRITHCARLVSANTSLIRMTERLVSRRQISQVAGLVDKWEFSVLFVMSDVTYHMAKLNFS